MSKLSAIFNFKCPTCHNGDLYKKPFNFSSAFEMNKRCANCNQNFEPEPGFYYGAMFIGYIITSLIFVSIALILVFVFDMNVNTALILVIIFGILSTVFFFRLARSVWLHLAIPKKTK